MVAIPINFYDPGPFRRTHWLHCDWPTTDLQLACNCDWPFRRVIQALHLDFGSNAQLAYWPPTLPIKSMKLNRMNVLAGKGHRRRVMSFSVARNSKRPAS